MEIITNPGYQQEAELQQLLKRLPEAFAAGEGELIYDKRNKLRRFVLPSGLVVIVKAYHHPNLFQRLCYSTCWHNKAIKSFRFGQKLLELGIDTPEPIAAITYYKYGCLVQSYYFVSTEDNRPDCKVLRDGHLDNPQPLIDAFMGFLIRLHEVGFMHGDANLSNFLYEEDSALNKESHTAQRFRFAVIDTNRSRFLNRPARRTEVYENLMRLTHVRPLLCTLVRSYARQRGWDEDEAEHAVLDLIKARERRKAFWKRFKRK